MDFLNRLRSLWELWEPVLEFIQKTQHSIGWDAAQFLELVTCTEPVPFLLQYKLNAVVQACKPSAWHRGRRIRNSRAWDSKDGSVLKGTVSSIEDAVLFPASKWWFTTIHNSSSVESRALFWLP